MSKSGQTVQQKKPCNQATERIYTWNGFDVHCTYMLYQKAPDNQHGYFSSRILCTYIHVWFIYLGIKQKETKCHKKVFGDFYWRLQWIKSIWSFLYQLIRYHTKHIYLRSQWTFISQFLLSSPIQLHPLCQIDNANYRYYRLFLNCFGSVWKRLFTGE